MTNREKYAEQILDIATTGHSIAIDKKGNFYKCSELECEDCIFSRCEQDNCYCGEKIKKWSEQEYVEPPIDWSKVPVDTKVFVRDSDSDPWKPRYFAKFEGGKIFTWNNGATSFSRNSVCDSSWWNQGKLAEDTV